MPITHTGDGLTLLVETGFRPIDEWMTFVLWRTAMTFVPDAKVILLSQRSKSYRRFRWCRKVGVPFITYPENAQPRIKSEPGSLVLPSAAACLRPYQEDAVGPTDIRTDQPTTFITYAEGFGRFVATDWLHINGYPFRRAYKRFATATLNVNETKLLQLWEQMAVSYQWLL